MMTLTMFSRFDEVKGYKEIRRDQCVRGSRLSHHRTLLNVRPCVQKSFTMIVISNFTTIIKLFSHSHSRGVPLTGAQHLIFLHLRRTLPPLPGPYCSSCSYCAAISPGACTL